MTQGRANLTLGDIPCGALVEFRGRQWEWRAVAQDFGHDSMLRWEVLPPDFGPDCSLHTLTLSRWCRVAPRAGVWGLSEPEYALYAD